MKNIGLEKYKYANVENFTSDFGIKIRRKLQKPFKLVLKCATKREIILERYQVLIVNFVHIAQKMILKKYTKFSIMIE